MSFSTQVNFGLQNTIIPKGITIVIVLWSLLLVSYLPSTLSYAYLLNTSDAVYMYINYVMAYSFDGSDELLLCSSISIYRSF